MEPAVIMPANAGNDFTKNEAKLLALVTLGFGSFVCGVLPLFCSRRNRERYPGLLSFLLCLGAGVLLATAVVHMLPELRESLKQFSEIVFCTGFFLIYTIDELVHYCGVGGHDHSSEDERPVRMVNNSDCEAEAGQSDGSSRGRFYGSNDETKSLLLHKSDGESLGVHRSTESLISGREQMATPAPSSSSHAPVPAEQDELTGVFGLLLALSVHSLLEGLAIGVQSSGPKVILLLGAVCAHKFVVGFSLGVELSTHGTRQRCSHILQVLTFSLGSVAGIGIGMGLDDLNETLTNLVMPVLQGLAGGTLLYVTVSEVLPRERRKRHSRSLGFVQLVAVMLGFTLMSVLSLVLSDE